MALKKDKRKATGPAKIPRTNTRSAEMDAKLKRIGELKAKFAGIAKAVRPALTELARRTSKQLSHPTYHKDGRRKAPYDALIEELEKVRDSNITRRVDYHKTYQELKAVSVQHETLQEMTNIENQYRKKVDEIRESSLTHVRLSYMIKINQIVNGGEVANMENLGQDANERIGKRPDRFGNNIVRYKETKASKNQHFYWSTKVMWDDWMDRMEANSEMARQGRILPRAYGSYQAEMPGPGAKGHRMQLHGAEMDRRPDSTWVGGTGNVAYLEAGEGHVGMACRGNG